MNDERFDESFEAAEPLYAEPDVEVRLTATTLDPADVVVLYTGHHRFRFRHPYLL